MLHHSFNDGQSRFFISTELVLVRCVTLGNYSFDNWFLIFLAQYYFVICSIFNLLTVMFLSLQMFLCVCRLLFLTNLTIAVLHWCFQRTSIWFCRLCLNNLFSISVISTCIFFFFLIISPSAFFGFTQFDFSNFFSWNLSSEFLFFFSEISI